MRRFLPTAFAVAVWLAGCTTSSVRPDLAAVNDLLVSRGALPAQVSMPDEDAFAAPEAQVERALAMPLTADAAARIALANSRTLRAAIVELGVPRGALVQAGLPPNLELELGASRAIEGEHDALEPEVGVELSLSRLILLSHTRGVAAAELDAARQRLAAEILDTAHRARLAFYDAQAAEQLLDVRTRGLQSFQATYETALELHRVGNLPDLDLDQERLAVESARVAVSLAEDQRLQAREQLNTLLGLNGRQTTWTVAGSLGTLPAAVAPAADLEKRAVENSLELAELRARLEAASGRVSLASARGWLSGLAVGARAEREAEIWQVGGHVEIALPVFDRGQGDAASAEAQRNGLQHRSEQAAVEARAAARLASARVESAWRRAVHFRDVLLPARQRVLAGTLRQYNAMQIGVFQLLQVQRETLDAGIASVDALLDYGRARAALDLVLAGGRASPPEVRSAPLLSAASVRDPH